MENGTLKLSGNMRVIDISKNGEAEVESQYGDRDDSNLTTFQFRFERYATIRAAYPKMAFWEIMERIGEDEINDAEEAEGRRILDQMDC